MAYQFNLPVQRDQLEAIGMVAVEWAYLESVIEAAIWNLAGIYSENTGAAITTHLGVPPRLDMLMTLFRLARGDGDEANQLDKMCKTIRGNLSSQRGEAVHTRWVEGDHGSPMMYTVRARGRLERSKKDRSAAKLQETAAAIAEQSTELRRFFVTRGVIFPHP
jgi:hypothetical protein